MIDRTHRLFREHDAIVEAHFRRRFGFVLVDEFQDTDPVQNGIICSILGNLAQTSAKLFVVGDPKQSIYLFRDADVTQFKRTRDLIEQASAGRPSRSTSISGARPQSSGSSTLSSGR